MVASQNPFLFLKAPVSHPPLSQFNRTFYKTNRPPLSYTKYWFSPDIEPTDSLGVPLSPSLGLFLAFFFSAPSVCSHELTIGGTLLSHPHHMSSSGDGCLLGRCPPFGELYFVTSHFKPRWGLHNTLPRYEPQFDSRPMQLSCSRCHIIFVEHIGFLIGFDGRYHYRFRCSKEVSGYQKPVFCLSY